MNLSRRNILVVAFIALLLFVTWVGWQYWISRNSVKLEVAGISMQPTLQPGDNVRLYSHENEPYKRGDLVAVKFKTRERMMVKRLIALPGDEVLWKNEQVFINGKLIVMDGWPEDRRIPQRSWKLLGIQLKNYANRVPDNNVIVMGDNTDKSYDSGDFGMLSMSQIAGLIKH